MTSCVARVALAAVLTAAAASAQAQNWQDIPFVSNTIGLNANRLCVGAPSSMKPSDIGCPSTAPYVDASGNVGIGTTAPLAPLTIKGPNLFSSGLLIGSKPPVSNIGPGDVIGGLDFISYDGQMSSPLPSARIQAVNGGSNHTASVANGDLTFSTVSDASTTMVERMRIDGSGKVGIGTTAPGAKLHVNYGNTPASSVEALRLEVTGSRASGRGPMMNFYAPYLGTGQSTLVAGVAGLTYANSSGYLAFYTSDGTTNSERVRVDSSGNVGIGTTSPNAKLDVYGTISATNLMLGGVAIASQTDRITSGTAAVTANYNTGVSVSAPLHVNGAVKIAGTNSEPCGPSSYGTIRYNSTLKAFQICRE